VELELQLLGGPKPDLSGDQTVSKIEVAHGLLTLEHQMTGFGRLRKTLQDVDLLATRYFQRP
jgi:hypothetical protein